MLLFSLSLIYTTWSLLSLDRIRYSTVLFTISFAALLCFSMINGLGHSADMQLLGEDVSPLLSFLTLPFFELTIRSKLEIILVIRIIVFAAIVMACCYAAIVVSLWLSFWLQVDSLGVLYKLVKGAAGGDIFISGGLTAQTGLPGHFIYSGALFIGIAIIYLVFKNGRWSRAVAFFLFLSMFLVASRGLFLSLALSAFCYVLIGPMRAIKKIGYGCIVILLAAISLPFLFSLSGNKTSSNENRLIAISEVTNLTTPVSLIVGHGFGIGVPEKPGHEEIAYLEIFQKQGLIGLLWWAALIATLAIRYRKALRSGNQYLAYPLFLSAIYILFQSATNPAVNNPVGMYPFIISFVGLGVLARPDAPRSAMNPRGSIDMLDTGVVDGEIGFN